MVLTSAAVPRARRTIALIPAGQFEDFFDKIGVSLDQFRDELTGGWLFNYVHALQAADIRVVLLYTSARVDHPLQFTHRDTGAPVWILPTPRLHRKIRHAHHRWFPRSRVLAAAASYIATPHRLLARILKQEGCDVMLCQEYEDPRFDSCVALGRLLQLPVFATYQGANHTGTAIERPLRRLTVRGCAGLIIASRSEMTRVQHVYGLSDSTIGHIPNPVDTDACGSSMRDDMRTELAIAADTRVVIWHGHVQIHRKGLDILLDAWDLICREHRDVQILLVLVGSGRNTGALRDRVEANPRILWIDRYVLDRRRLWSYLSAADVYTLPSRHEGFAVAPLEAMACGLPIVASDVSGVRDLLPREEEDGGIIVASEDSSGLAKALWRLIHDPPLATQLGMNARRRVEQEFTFGVVGSKLRRFLFDRSPETARGPHGPAPPPA